MSDSIEPRVISSVGMGICTLGLALLAFLGLNTPLYLLIIDLIVMGLGMAFFASPNTNAAMSSVEDRWFGTASAILSTMRQTGGILSIGIVMLLFALFIGRVEITPQYYPEFVTSLKTAFTISSVLCFVGIFMSLARGATHEHAHTS
jgi:MFS family permease